MTSRSPLKPLLVSLTVAASLAAAAPAALAQDAPQTPVSQVHLDSEMVIVVSEPQAAAGGRVLMWQWTFYREPREVGKDTIDAMAALHEYDCRARTQAPIRFETFRNEQRQNVSEGSRTARTAEPGSVRAASLEVACGRDPEFESLPSPWVARRGAIQFWTGQ